MVLRFKKQEEKEIDYMNELKIFQNKEFGEIRTLIENGEPWLVGKDVCESFGDTNYRRSLSSVDDDDKRISQIETPGGKQNMIVINESGLYSLLFQMQPQKAKGVSQNDSLVDERIEKLHRFKRWVTSEVLPSIRKNGGYIAGQETMTDDELMARALQVAQNKIQERDKQIETMKPKAIFADAVAASHTSILVGELAKILKQNGVNIGQNRLYEWLRENGYLIRGNKRTDRNAPTQRSMDMGLFEVKISTVVNSDGSVRETRTTKVTGKGQQYFINKFLTE
jgi:anti-repressor protein|nr:MAG TPA: repressor domain protein [Caudoviricetes sp.]